MPPPDPPIPPIPADNAAPPPPPILAAADADRWAAAATTDLDADGPAKAGALSAVDKHSTAWPLRNVERNSCRVVS